MKYLVRLYGSLAQNPSGIPAEWPAEVSTVSDDVDASPDDRLLLTEEEYAQYRSDRQHLYDAWIDTYDVQAEKNAKLDSIDSRTTELISDGFEFPPGSGNMFSLSLEGQALRLGAYQSRNSPLMAYPIEWSMKDNSGSLQITTPEMLEEFHFSALATIRLHRDSGNALKSAVRAAQTKSEVASITDPR